MISKFEIHPYLNASTGSLCYFFGILPAEPCIKKASRITSFTEYRKKNKNLNKYFKKRRKSLEKVIFHGAQADA